MTALIVIASVVAYLAVGAVYARSQVVSCYRRAKAEWTYESIYMESVRWMVAWRVFGWPYALILDGGRGFVGGWLMAPLNDRKAAAQQARDDAERWWKLHETGTPAEREMAAELARMCGERAKELEL